MGGRNRYNRSYAAPMEWRDLTGIRNYDLQLLIERYGINQLYRCIKEASDSDGAFSYDYLKSIESCFGIKNLAFSIKNMGYKIEKINNPR
jgi:hypothetical protein